MLRCLFIACLSTQLPIAAGAVDFAKDVYPVLRRSCFECHGHDKQEGKLRLDVPEAAKHVAVSPGAAANSELLRRVALPAEDEDAMPRRGARLTGREMGHLRDWIAAGAPWPTDLKPPQHWAYVKPVLPTVPTPKRANWAANEVDRFVLARLEEAGLEPSAEASPAVLLRRLSFDARGLPPTPAEVLEFEAAYAGGDHQKVWEAWVDRLLSSPDFGVRWARPWLDLARYADSHGYQRDDLRSIWAYRDWVVAALNADMPFDQFTIEQVAGDLLPKASPAQITATGFHRCTPTNVEAGTDPEESRINQVIDRVNTTGAVWLGTTMECAQCHNHKYDPFSQRDYYGLLAYFNNTEKEAERTNPKTPGSIQFIGVPMKLPGATNAQEKEALKLQVEELDRRIAALQPKAKASPPPSGKPPALLPFAFSAESGAEHELLPDDSVLLAGKPEDNDTYVFKAKLTEPELKAVLIQALTDESLPGNGPGRGNATRPNFVLSDVEISVGTGDKEQRLKFASAKASFSQPHFGVANLIDADASTGWAINPEFGKSHWAALELAEPMKIPSGSSLTVKLVQNYGGGRSIGRLRITVISGDVASALPGDEADLPVGQQLADPRTAKLRKHRAALIKQLADTEELTTEVMKELSQPRMTSLFKRGDWTQPGEAVLAATPAVFDSKADGAPNRLTLARWLVSRDNPLTARVTVNRWWAEIFGHGIVSTVEDFGIKGDPPSHPELLDYLAIKFMDGGWSMKQLLHLILTSATYRQASTMRDADRDPANELLARGPRMRLDAEAVRDNALAIAGLLSGKLGGPSIRPPQPDGLWTKVGGKNYKYEVSAGDEKYRRGLYVVLKRGSPYPSMVNFDASARMACVVRRSRSNTPLQALTLLNDPVFVEASQALARRIVKEAPSASQDARLEYGFRLALARAPTDRERAVLSDLLAAQPPAKTESKPWEAVATALLNLDETITKP